MKRACVRYAIGSLKQWHPDIEVALLPCEESYASLAPTPRFHTFSYLLAFIFFTEFLPAESFLVDFLVSKGFSNHDLVNNVFPLYMYFRLPAYLIMAFLSEAVGSTAMLTVGASFGCITVAMTRFCTTLGELQFTQFTAAMSAAGHATAFWAAVHESHQSAANSMEESSTPFQVYVHRIKAMLALSNCLAGITGSFLLQTFQVSYARLWEISLCAQVASFLVALGLSMHLALPQCGTWNSWSAQRLSLSRMHSSLVEICGLFTLPAIVEWTVWHVAFHVGHLTVATFWQSLLRLQTGTTQRNNGYIVAIGFLLGMAALLATSNLSSLSRASNRWWLTCSSLLVSGLLTASMALAKQPWQLYACYVASQVVFRVATACRTQQLVAEVSACQRQANLRAGQPEGGHPPIAFLFGISDFAVTVVHALIMLLFKQVRGSDGNLLPLATRFELLGIAMCGVGLLPLLMRAWSFVCRQRS